MPLQEESDFELLGRFYSKCDEAAFTLLVERHLKIVFAVAQNCLGGDAQLAEDVCQIVFAQLARKAKSLHHDNVKAWLFKTSRFTAAKIVRSRTRQSAKERRYEQMSEKTVSDESEELKAFIDESIEQLPQSDQEAILLRYFESMDYNTIGTRLGMQPNAARMKVSRALDKLQTRFKGRGIATTATALSAALTGYASCSLPAHLATSVATVSLANIGSLASVGLVSALKLPLVATAATIVAGLALEQQTTPETADPVAQDTQLLIVHEETEVPQPTETTRTLDKIDIAYAALDQDATVLAQRLKEVESQIQKLHHRRPQGGKVYSIKELDMKPRATAMMMPDYPVAHAVTQESGSAVVEFILGVDGKTSDLRVLKASHPDFAESALKAVAKSEFTPGRIGSTAVQTHVRIPIHFTPSAAEGQPKTKNWF
ncbi:TonB family protein [Pelagicoccus sp. SDUM812002]|uniref:TonB family protein n=1 Tax=Pelagicoccus sp. SDUM812002 TaxID=3041266 RepID=UPI00280C51FA|nr:TonB family protein [Pelagicoccus sp. SDUM812002]MDQ8185396.1 TonB family protein [Pelagicoccus sp. SDUM812002]